METSLIYFRKGGTVLEQAPRATDVRNFDQFIAQVQALLEPTAAGKGYNTTGIDGKNELYEFVQGIAGDGHALGEIIYKAKRYAAKHNPEDILKVAAWSYLIWRHRQAS